MRTPMQVRFVTPDDLPAEAYALDFPTEGEWACRLWELLSGGYMPLSDASVLYRACGYIPFCGYPLVRSGRVNGGVNGKPPRENPGLIQG